MAIEATLSGQGQLSFSLKRLSFMALGLFIFTIPWERSVAVPGIGAAGKLVGIVALGLGVMTLFERGNLRFRPPSLLLGAMIAFLTWSILSSLWSIAPRGSLSRSITYLQLIMMVWLVWQQTRSREQHMALIQAYVLGGYVSILAVVFEFVRSAGGDGLRLSGLDSNANWAALALAIGIPMAWYLMSQHRHSLLLWVNVAYVPLAVFSIGLTASRGGLIVATIGLSVILLTYAQLRIWRKIAIFILLALALFGAYRFIPTANLDRLAEAPSEISQGDLTNRRDIWSAGLSIYWNSPYLGVGSGGFPKAVEQILNNDKASHNAFISILVELGLIGLLIFVALFVIALLPILLYEPFPTKSFYLILWLALVTALMPANWEIHKATWFVLALLSTRRALVMRDRSQGSVLGRNVVG